MKCPVCETVDLMMTERQGIEIDYCPTCRGIWLDRGELDKIIDRSRSGGDFPRQEDPRKRREDVVDYDDPRKRREDVPTQQYYDDDDYDDRNRRPHKRKTWLDDVFDIFD